MVTSIKVNPRPNGLTGDCLESLVVVFMDSGIGLRRLFFTRTFHPPAGIDPLIIVNESLPWSFLFGTVLPGSLLLMCFALVWHNAARRGAWPARWR